MKGLVALGLVLAVPRLATAADATPFFTDVTAASGLDFVHFNGMSGRFYYPEVVGSGGALFDMDNDGDLDLYLVQGSMLGPDRTLDDALFPPRHPTPLGDRLYRNESAAGAGDSAGIRFIDVTRESGIVARGYGMGVAAGDYDNDGFVDLFVSNLGPDQLWRNRGDGTFEDKSDAIGAPDSSWSVSAAFVDYDADGWLDLIVTRYLEWTYAVHKACITERGEEDYCPPTAFSPKTDRLFHNQGDGSFRDLSEAAGLTAEAGNGLGVSTADFNGDGLIDIYVANDLTPNLLWLNQGDGSFRNEALIAGCALSGQGKPESSMGVDAADLDSDGDEDLFLTHYNRESNTVYLNDGQGFFRDVSDESGLGSPSWIYTSWGTAWLDYDMDGRLDILAVNGAVTRPPGADLERNAFPLDEPNQLFRNLGEGRFEEVTSAAGTALQTSEVSRGAMFGDLDNDGDTDVVIANNNGPARVLRAEADTGRPWIGLRLASRQGGRDALGARVAVLLPGAVTLWRRARADGSYASSSDPRVLVALGESASDLGSVEVRVHWPEGSEERWERVDLNRYSTLRQGEGTEIP